MCSPRSSNSQSLSSIVKDMNTATDDQLLYSKYAGTIQRLIQLNDGYGNDRVSIGGYGRRPTLSFAWKICSLARAAPDLPLAAC